MDPLEVVKCSDGYQYGQFLDLRGGGETREQAMPILDEQYALICEVLLKTGLVPTGERQIIYHTAEDNADGYGPYPTLGWKQTFKHSEEGKTK